MIHFNQISPDFWAFLAKFSAAMFGAIFVLAVLWVMWLKVSLKGKIGCYFLEPTDDITTELLKYNKVLELRPMLTSSTDEMDYFLNTRLQRRIRYPSGLPVFMQEVIPAQVYVRGTAEPVNWRDMEREDSPANTSAVLKSVKNVSALNAMTERMNDEFGANRLKQIQSMMMFGLVVIGVGLAIVGFISYKNYKALESLVPIIDAIRKHLGS